MRILGCCVATLCLLVSASLAAQEPQAPQAAPPASADGLPSWAPGPLRPANEAPVEGRVAVRNLGVAFTLPPAWRSADVAWRELSATEVTALMPIAESAMVVELVGKGAAETLLTIYRVPLKGWREADRLGKPGPGRIAITTPDKAYVVVRPVDNDAPGRYGELRHSLEDAVGTLALYDAYHEEGHLRPQFGSDFAGKLANGDPVALHMSDKGELSLTWGKKAQTVSGKWFQRDSQLIGRLTSATPKVNPSVLMHYDGTAFVVIAWDQAVFGNIGVRLEKSP